VSAPARVPRHAFDLRQQHGVETPEHVVLSFELAGLGTRAAAAAIDLLILFCVYTGMAMFFAVARVGAEWSSTLGSWGTAIVVLVLGLGFFLYYVLFEALGDGRTPGKRVLGIRVVLDTGRSVTANAATVRNLIRIVDFLVPLGPLPGSLLVFLHPANKRLGDLAAGTIVVRDRVAAWSLAPAPPPMATEALELGPPELTDQEFQLLDRFLARAHELAPAVRNRLTTELSHRFEPRIPRRDADADAYLTTVFADEQQKRRGRFATRATGSAGRTTVTGERFLARKRDAWEAFRAAAQELEAGGLARLPAAEIPGFAARYREVAADLARARTYGVDPQVVAYLERLVGAGHNVLYQARATRRAPFASHLLNDFPAAVVESWRYVLAAFLLFMVPAVIGYVMIRERPQLAEEIVSPVMVSRAEQAAERQAEGLGYARAESGERPVIAAAIISNNIRVCIVAFAGGMLAGLLTVWALVFNGMAIGTGFGVFANYHAAGYLATFVAAHGVLELTAIFISGGAGFRLAHALIAPGDRTRLDALVVDGRIAMRMVGAVVFLLAIAGAIEGLLSTSDAPAALKFAVSGASAVLLVLYLLSGYRYLGEAAAAATTTARS
jgi:uncharacterized membrane protein SpoIIM required for sporulation/uncharacterized RDD family membrane protein YckC